MGMEGLELDIYMGMYVCMYVPCRHCMERNDSCNERDLNMYNVHPTTPNTHIHPGDPPHPPVPSRDTHPQIPARKPVPHDPARISFA